MTNIERLRKMTPEELTSFLKTLTRCWSNDCNRCPLYDAECSLDTGIEIWLEREETE